MMGCCFYVSTEKTSGRPTSSLLSLSPAWSSTESESHLFVSQCLRVCVLDSAADCISLPSKLHKLHLRRNSAESSGAFHTSGFSGLKIGNTKLMGSEVNAAKNTQRCHPQGARSVGERR